MAHTFHEIEDTGEKCTWCRENLRKGCWSWSLNQGHTNIFGQYIPTSVRIHIEDDIDATAYKLRWT